MQHFLKPFIRSARAGIVSAELFEKLFIGVDDALAAFDVCSGRVTPAPFAGALKSRAG